MFLKNAQKKGTADGQRDAWEGKPRDPRPQLIYSVLSGAHLDAYVAHYHRSYAAAERDKDFLRREVLLRDRRHLRKEERDEIVR